MNSGERIRDLNADINPALRGDPSTAGQISAEPPLSPCPCGEPAVWYRADQPGAGVTPGRGKAVSAMGTNDIHENLCEACFRAVFGGEERAGWVRI